MNNIDRLSINGSSVIHRPSKQVNASHATLVLLHGYGADEYDLMGLAPYFDEDIQIFCIRGPRSTLYGGASWFDIDMLADGSLKFNTEQAIESTSLVLNVIDSLQQEGQIHHKKIILGGFSQGATISNLVTIEKSRLIQALLIMSGRLPDGFQDLVKEAGQFADMPVFAGHGTLDNVIPVDFGRQIVKFWEKTARLEHYEYPMGHEICQPELEHIQEWLHKIIV